MGKTFDELLVRTYCELDEGHIPSRGSLGPMSHLKDAFANYSKLRTELTHWNESAARSEMPSDGSDGADFWKDQWSQAITEATALREQLAEEIHEGYRNQKVSVTQELVQLEKKCQDDNAMLNRILDDLNAIDNESLGDAITLLVDMKGYVETATLGVKVTSAFQVGKSLQIVGELGAVVLNKALSLDLLDPVKLIEAKGDIIEHNLANIIGSQNEKDITSVFVLNDLAKTGITSLQDMYLRIRNDVDNLWEARGLIAVADAGMKQAESIFEHCKETAELHNVENDVALEASEAAQAEDAAHFNMEEDAAQAENAAHFDMEAEAAQTEDAASFNMEEDAAQAEDALDVGNADPDEPDSEVEAAEDENKAAEQEPSGYDATGSFNVEEEAALPPPSFKRGGLKFVERDGTTIVVSTQDKASTDPGIEVGPYEPGDGTDPGIEVGPGDGTDPGIEVGPYEPGDGTDPGIESGPLRARRRNRPWIRSGPLRARRRVRLGR